MEVWEYYRSLVSQAWNDSLTVMQWQPFYTLVIAGIVFGITFVLVSRFVSRSEARKQLRSTLYGVAANLAVLCVIFLVALIFAPYRLARAAQTTAAAQLAAAQADTASARAEADALRQRLDDRQRQQEKADEYTTWINSGRDISVHWADAQLRGNQQGMITQRDASRVWLKDVRTRLDADFGPQVAARFNFGRPSDTPIGFSEPKEHEARVAELIRMIGEMREGHLPIRVR